MLTRTVSVKELSPKTTAEILLVLREDISARSVTSFPLTQTKHFQTQGITNQGVMNPDSTMGQVEQDKGGLNLKPEISLSLREMYLFNNATDDDVSPVRGSNEITSDDHQPDVRHRGSDVKFGQQYPTTAQPESYDNDNYRNDNDLYPPPIYEAV